MAMVPPKGYGHRRDTRTHPRQGIGISGSSDNNTLVQTSAAETGGRILRRLVSGRHVGCWLSDGRCDDDDDDDDNNDNEKCRGRDEYDDDEPLFTKKKVDWQT